MATAENTHTPTKERTRETFFDLVEGVFNARSDEVQTFSGSRSLLFGIASLQTVTESVEVGGGTLGVQVNKVETARSILGRKRVPQIEYSIQRLKRVPMGSPQAITVGSKRSFLWLGPELGGRIDEAGTPQYNHVMYMADTMVRSALDQGDVVNPPEGGQAEDKKEEK